MSSTTSIAIGVPTASYLTATAAVEKNKTTLELLLNLQKLVDEFKGKVAEMDDEMQAVKIENNILRQKIKALTTSSAPVTTLAFSSRRGFFGYDADEF